MARYVARRERADWDDDHPLLPHLEVFEPDRWTGLYDSEGRRFMRLPNPIGFGRDKEWV